MLHSRVQQTHERCFVVGTDHHASLESVLLHYRKHCIYRDVKLRHPVTFDIINKSSVQLKAFDSRLNV